VAASTIETLLALRRRFPYWGARKLIKFAARQDPKRVWPSRATLCTHLKAAGLTRRRRVRPARGSRPAHVLTQPTACNVVWTADYKGHFRTRDHRYCYPFTLRDGFSRFLLRCDARVAATTAVTRVSCERAFAAYGLPECIRSDNGAPFARPGLAQLSRLAVWWMRLGIRVERMRPAHPEENASHEQMHGVLKCATTRPSAVNCRAQQDRFRRFRYEYNELRPHEALDDATPASVYRPSTRCLPAQLPAVEYPGHWEVRRVQTNGDVRWHTRRLFLSKALAGETVAFEEVDEGLWTVRFVTTVLARFDARTYTLQPVDRVTPGRNAAKPPCA
jgi:transposase InsO family protein